MTDVFEDLARTAARAHGHPAMRLVALPHPMESRPPAEVREIARARFAEVASLLAEQP